jgi:hypothetical protein
MKWSPADDQRLLELKADSKSVPVVAKIMHRTEASVISRYGTLKKREANEHANAPETVPETTWASVCDC